MVKRDISARDLGGKEESPFLLKKKIGLKFKNTQVMVHIYL
ncbi:MULTISPECIES: hypothetical protein [Bacillus]|nr:MULTISPECIES: hypothetical protein [Bacillus]SCN05672.1 Protein of unknown function [Bacillus wiedmannii]